MPKTDDGGWVLDESNGTFGVSVPVCLYCKHLHPTTPKTCDAFINIPDEIWDGMNNHMLSYPGDNGITFELKD